MRLRALWSLVLGGMLIGFSAPAAMGGSPVFVVDDDGMASSSNCNAAMPTFSNIQTAVTAASSGSTIKVCPGNYSSQQVVVDKTLYIRGAQAGHSAQSCLPRPNESRVQASAGGGGTGAFWIKANKVRIDGFLIDNNGGPGIQTDSAYSGFVIANNRIRNNVMGVYLNANPAGTSARSRVFHNCLANNNLSGAASGNGIYSDQGLRHASIWANTFKHNKNAGNLLTAAGNTLKNVSVVANKSIDDRTFIAAYGGNGLLVEGNNVINADASFGDAGSAIYVGGGSDVGGDGANGVSVLDNKVNSDHYAGIAIRGDADNILIRGNDISNTTNGIDISSPAVGSSVVEWNQVHNVGGRGIYLQAATSENEITDNTVNGSGLRDCRDESSGPGTAGTANEWLRNVGATSNPAGLCTP